MKLAAIDIGSNSIHLVIVKAVPGQHAEIIDREKDMVRLGSGSLRQHRLAKDTIDRAVVTLKRFRKMAEANRVDLIISTATSAVRESNNADEFIDRVRKEVGLDVQVLPGVEEARLIALAVSEVTDFHGRRALIIDIGGGSTELIITDGGEPELLRSLRLGAVRLTDKFVSTDPISDDELERLVSNIRADLTRSASEVATAGYDFVIGTSGTVLNMVDAIVLADSVQQFDGSARIEAFSETVSLDQIRMMNRRLAKMTVRQRGRVPGLEKGRADIIIAGGFLLETILSEVGANEIASCDWSLREGVLLNYLRNAAPRPYRSKKAIAAAAGARDAILDPEVAESALDVRGRSVLSVARRYAYDVPHSHHVARLATRLFDDTVELHEMGPGDRSLLQYASLLHDIGYHIAHNNHHRHSLYLIKNSEMPGFTATEIGLMAAIVRYHRGSRPRKGGGRMRREHEDYFSLDRAERTKLLKLAAILQIADGLDRAHRQTVTDVSCRITRSKVKLTVKCAGECDLEIWSAERKALWFTEVFQIGVQLSRVVAQPVARSQPA